MTQSAVAFKDTFNGYEKRSDGLWMHKGRADIASMRVTNNLNPRNGAGIEMVFDPQLAAPTNALGVIACYDRDAAAWRDLQINAKNITLTPQGGGKLSLPANSVQQLLNYYQGAPTWSTTVNTWVATPITVQVTTGGGLLRIEMSSSLYHSAAGASFYTGLGWDGTAQIGMSYDNAAGVNYYVSVSWVYYLTLAAGLHTLTVYVYNATAGTLTLGPAVASFLYVTEQKA